MISLKFLLLLVQWKKRMHTEKTTQNNKNAKEKEMETEKYSNTLLKRSIEKDAEEYAPAPRFLLSLDEKSSNFHAAPSQSLTHLSLRILLQLLSFDFLSLTSARVVAKDGSLLRVLKILTSHSSHTFSHPLVLLAVVKGVHTLWEKTDLRNFPDVFATGIFTIFFILIFLYYDFLLFTSNSFYLIYILISEPNAY